MKSEPKFPFIVHMIDGIKLYGAPVGISELIEIEQYLGDESGRLRFPLVDGDSVMMATRRINYIEAIGLHHNTNHEGE